MVVDEQAGAEKAGALRTVLGQIGVVPACVPQNSDAAEGSALGQDVTGVGVIAVTVHEQADAGERAAEGSSTIADVTVVSGQVDDEGHRRVDRRSRTGQIGVVTAQVDDDGSRTGVDIRQRVADDEPAPRGLFSVQKTPFEGRRQLLHSKIKFLP